MSSADTLPLMLLALHGLALGMSIVFLSLIYALHRRAYYLDLKLASDGNQNSILFFPPFLQRPTTWLAIRSVNPKAVQSALGPNRATLDSWSEGMTGGRDFFISPQVHGWVIVTGPGLPNPGDDVDACFHFLLTLSRRLGHVQFFHANGILHHHAWARLDEGCVTRAYAWAGETVWNQGAKTLPEIELGMKCVAYGENPGTNENVETNAKKVPLLAARWSLDPAEINSRLVKHITGIRR
ncbi:MAG TPA: hypothetical protein VN836_09590 [Verrucomicrobiae bacterium]|nr:hypothetical protein [Verrucomicrobiae bacterium]